MEGHALVPSMGWVRSVVPGPRHDLDRAVTRNFMNPRYWFTMWGKGVREWIRWTWWNPCYNEPVLGEDSIYVQLPMHQP